MLPHGFTNTVNADFQKSVWHQGYELLWWQEIHLTENIVSVSSCMCLYWHQSLQSYVWHRSTVLSSSVYDWGQWSAWTHLNDGENTLEVSILVPELRCCLSVHVCLAVPPPLVVSPTLDLIKEKQLDCIFFPMFCTWVQLLWQCHKSLFWSPFLPFLSLVASAGRIFQDTPARFISRPPTQQILIFRPQARHQIRRWTGK